MMVGLRPKASALQAPSAQPTSEPPAITKLQYASYLTAVLAYLIMRQQDAVGMTSFDSEIRLEMPARSSPRHFDEMMNHLEAIAPGQTTNLGATLNRLADRFKRRCLIILISDLYDEPEAVDRAFHHFRHKRHEVVVFHVLDGAELDFPFQEATLFRGLEQFPELLTDPRSLRRGYLAEVQSFVVELQTSCRAQDIDYVQLRTDTNLGVALSSYLAHRLTRKGN